jgi:hypothetical protein
MDRCQSRDGVNYANDAPTRRAFLHHKVTHNNNNKSSSNKMDRTEIENI